VLAAFLNGSRQLRERRGWPPAGPGRCPPWSCQHAPRRRRSIPSGRYMARQASFPNCRAPAVVEDPGWRPATL